LPKYIAAIRAKDDSPQAITYFAKMEQQQKTAVEAVACLEKRKFKLTNAKQPQLIEQTTTRTD